jgi:hypothetical protein
MAGTVVVELGLFAAGLAIYSKATRAKNKIGSYCVWTLTVFLTVMYVVNLTGPPPPDESMIPVVTLGLWLFVPWAYWIDRHREA